MMFEVRFPRRGVRTARMLAWERLPAIVHGPATARHATEWQQLDAAGAARQVADAAQMADTIAELTQPDLVAALASSAWTISTGGADVANRIAAPVLEALAEARP